MVLRAVSWRLACWLWVGVPILGWLPGAPVRLTAVWFSVAASLMVVALANALPRRPAAASSLWGWVGCATLGIALLHLRQPTQAFLWACHVGLTVAAAAHLTAQAEWRWLREVVVVCALAQVVVWGAQQLDVPTPWPVHGWTKQGWGTVGSKTPAGLLLATAALWTHGWRAVGLSGLTCLTGSGTAILAVVVRGAWAMGGRRLALPVVVGGGAWWFQAAWSARWTLWQTWHMTVRGIGFRPLPGGFQDDTAIGQALGWRDYHNTYLDWLMRCGTPGGVLLLVLLLWLWRAARRTAEGRRLVVFSLWVGCWQSLEQFPSLIPVLLSSWIMVAQRQGARHAVASV